MDEDVVAPSELADRAENVARRLSLLANPSRLLILCRLAEGEASVGTLLTVVGLSQSALSQHLAKLRGGRVVATRRDAQTIYYRIDDAQTEAIMSALYEVFCRPGESEPRPADEGPRDVPRGSPPARLGRPVSSNGQTRVRTPVRRPAT